MANFNKPAGLNDIWAFTGTRVDPGSIKTASGWVVELPPYQTANHIEYKQDSFIAHTNQHGMPVWDAATEYQGGVSYTKGSNGLIYKCLATHTNFDPVNPLNSAYWVRAFESYGAVQAVQTQLDAHITNYQTLAGISNVNGARTNLSVFSKAESDTRFAFKAGTNTQAFSVGTATLGEHAVRLDQVNGLITQASESVLGVTRYATSAETETGTIDDKAVTPLKGATVYLKKTGNLSGLANVATARTNLGLGTIAVEAATSFLRGTNNLSELSNVTTARSNLGLTSSATLAETTWLKTANNFSDVPNKPLARTNLGLGTMSTETAANYLLKANNLSDVASATVARANLGLTTSATLAETTWLKTANLFADVPDKPTARFNLGLTSTAVRDETYFLRSQNNFADLTNVAAARANLGLSDSGLYPSNTWLVAANNFVDVPNKQGARNNLGLQALATWNPVGVNAAGVAGQYLNFNALVQPDGWLELPNGMILQWGITATVGMDSAIGVNFPRVFPNGCFGAHWTQIAGMNVLARGNTAVLNVTTTGFTLVNGGDGAGQCYWYAYGY